MNSVSSERAMAKGSREQHCAAQKENRSVKGETVNNILAIHKKKGWLVDETVVTFGTKN